MIDLKLPSDRIVELRFTAPLNHDEFQVIVETNRDPWMELTEKGTIVIKGGHTFSVGSATINFIADLKNYTRKNGGIALSSNTGYALPDGSIRCACTSYISPVQLYGVSDDVLDHYFPAAPFFVVEIKGSLEVDVDYHQRVRDVWIANGTRLCWFLDLTENKFWIYRQNGSVDLIENFDRTIDGEDVLPGFEFDLRNLI